MLVLPGSVVPSWIYHWFVGLVIFDPYGSNCPNYSSTGSPPPEPYQPPVDLKVDPLPSLIIWSYSSSSSFSGENMQDSN